MSESILAEADVSAAELRASSLVVAEHYTVQLSLGVPGA